MRETNHGRYIEVTDEKEAIQVSAYVVEPGLLLCLRADGQIERKSCV